MSPIPLPLLPSNDFVMTFYEVFCEEVGALTIKADDPAAKVVGELTRAAKRAELVIEGAVPRVKDRKS